MTRKRMVLLVFGVAIIAVITLVTALRSPSPFPVNIVLPESQRTAVVVDGDTPESRDEEATDDGDTLSNRESNTPDRVIARKNDATRITLRTPDELAAFLAKFRNNNPYRLSKLFSQQDVPALMVLLKNPKYVQEWATAMMIAAWVDKKGILQPRLIHYLKTDYGRRIDGIANLDANKFTRYTAVIALGHVADDRGIELLETIALSNEGLYSVAGDWLYYEPTGHSHEHDLERYIGTLRGKAALGLVYSQNRSSIALVEELHRETVDAINMAARAHNLETVHGFEYMNVFNGEQQMLMKLYYSLVDALAIRDAIDEMGFAGFHSALDTADKSFNVIAPYMGKYRINYN